MKNLLLIGLFGFAGWQTWKRYGPVGSAPPELASFRDTQGREHSFKAPMKPTAVVLWITECAYCDRAMGALDALGRDFPEEKLERVGFYINRADDATVDQFGRQEGHQSPLAQGQPTGEFVQALLRWLKFAGPGRHIYLIDKTGKVRAVESKDLDESADSLYKRLLVAVKESGVS